MDFNQGDTVFHPVWGIGEVHLVDTAVNLLGVYFHMAEDPSHWVHPVSVTNVESADRTQFVLDSEAFDRFLTLLNRPATDNPKLEALAASQPPWADSEPEVTRCWGPIPGNATVEYRDAL